MVTTQAYRFQVDMIDLASVHPEFTRTPLNRLQSGASRPSNCGRSIPNYIHTFVPGRVTCGEVLHLIIRVALSMYSRCHFSFGNARLSEAGSDYEEFFPSNRHKTLKDSCGSRLMVTVRLSSELVVL